MKKTALSTKSFKTPFFFWNRDPRDNFDLPHLSFKFSPSLILVLRSQQLPADNCKCNSKTTVLEQHLGVIPSFLALLSALLTKRGMNSMLFYFLLSLLTLSVACGSPLALPNITFPSFLLSLYHYSKQIWTCRLSLDSDTIFGWKNHSVSSSYLLLVTFFEHPCSWFNVASLVIYIHIFCRRNIVHFGSR